MATSESLRSHLQRHVLVLIGAALLVNALLVSLIVVFESRDDLDEDLSMSSRLLSLSIRAGAIELPALPLPISYQLWSAAGELQAHSADAGQSPMVPLQPGYSTYRAKHLMRAYVSRRDDGGWIVVASLYWHHLTNRVGELVLLMALPALFVFPLLAMLIAWIVRRSSVAMRTTANQIANRDRDDFTPVDASTLPDEVHSLVDAFNRLLSRLSSSLDAERRFNDTAAHELRTPMAAIRLDAQLLQHRVDDPAIIEALRRIDAASLSSAQLLEELLTLARLPDRPQDAERAPIALGRIVDVVLHDLAPALERDGIIVARDVDETRIVPLSQLLHLILRNLLENSLRHAGRFRHLGLSAHERDGMLELCVTDDGVGIAPDDRQRIFERFVQLRGHGAGTGLGLYIVRRVVERFGGRIQVSEGPGGQGAAFNVVLPLLD